MKNLIANILTLSLIASLLSNSAAGEDANTNIALSVLVAKQELLPAEPIMLTLSLSNQNKDAVEIPGRWKRLAGIQFKEKQAKEWSSLTRWWEPETSLPPLPPVVVKAGETVSARYALYSFGPAGEFQFQASHTYLIRAVFPEALASLSSRPKTVQVMEVPQSEIEAYQELLKSREHMLLLAPIRSINDISASPAKIEDFIEHFPESIYSDYLRFTYISYSKYKAVFFAKTNVLKAYKTHLSRSNRWMLDAGSGIERR